MLEPQDRRLLMESLRPPEGYALDGAIGTTYSLDLLALLTAPLAFTLFDCEDDEGRTAADPLALLEAVRRNASKMAIFCQAGQIAIPRRDQRLLSYLEDAICQVAPPGASGVFHPKVWILRFRQEGQPVLYRLVCLSRNLTFDRSWDTVAVLDGELIDKQRAFAGNHPLADFVKALPGLAVGRVPSQASTMVEQFQTELRRVRFDVPEGFESYRFWPLGLPEMRNWPFKGRVDRLLVVSPFLSDGCLKRLAGESEGNILISRSQAIQQVAAASLEPYEQIHVLSAAAAAEPAADDAEPETSALTDLHAKLYVADAGWDARVWTGSANATDAAFNQNVEFLLELGGKKSFCGIDAVLGVSGDPGALRAILEDAPRPVEPGPVDELAGRLENALQEARRALWSAGFTAEAFGEADATQYRLRLTAAARVNLPEGVTVRCWPATTQETRAVVIAGAPIGTTDMGVFSFEALTAFMAFEVIAEEAGRSAAARFVLHVGLTGVPEDRQARTLRWLLRDPEQVMRLLLLLLSEGGLDAGGALLTGTSVGGASVGRGSSGGPQLFETLVRALGRNPQKLDEIATLVADLSKTADGAGLLPEGFRDIWAPIWAARESLRK